MTSSSDKGGKKGPDEKASDTRAPEGLEDFISNPAAAMAAATAFGMGMAAQMGRLFLGTLQGAMDVTGQLARQLEEERKAAEAEADKAAAPEVKTEAPAEITRTEPPAPKASAKVKAAKPAAPKAKAKAPAKAAVTKVEKPKPAPKAKAAATQKAKAVPEATVTPKVKAAPKAKASPKAEVKAKVEPKVEPKVEIAAPAPKPKKAPKTISGKADDLKKIDGVGPKVEQVLKGRGISRFQDLAAMDEKALAALDKDLGLDGRVLRDDWAGQARRLAGGKARSGK